MKINEDAYRDEAQFLLIEHTAEVLREGAEPEFEGLPKPGLSENTDLEPVIEKMGEIVRHINESWGGVLTVDAVAEEDDDVLFAIMTEAIGGPEASENAVLAEMMALVDVEIPNDLEKIGLEAALREAAYTLDWDWTSRDLLESDKIQEKLVGEDDLIEQIKMVIAANPNKANSFAMAVYNGIRNSFPDNAEGEMYIQQFLKTIARVS